MGLKCLWCSQPSVQIQPFLQLWILPLSLVPEVGTAAVACLVDSLDAVALPVEPPVSLEDLVVPVDQGSAVVPVAVAAAAVALVASSVIAFAAARSVAEAAAAAAAESPASRSCCSPHPAAVAVAAAAGWCRHRRYQLPARGWPWGPRRQCVKR